MEERKGLTLQGGGRQMEIDGGRDREIKRNMPLGVTEEGVRVSERDEGPAGLRTTQFLYAFL